MKKTLFIKNAAILTATSIILRILGIVFKVWMASHIGSEGIGLYHLVFSVYVLASAFASAGIPTAVTRLISEAFAKNDTARVLIIIKRALCVCLAFAFFSFLIVWSLADFISIKLLGDARAIFSLKILCFSLPFMGISSIFKSYFFAKRNVMVNSVAVLLEQITRIVLLFLFVTRFVKHSIAAATAAIILADVLSEIVSCLFILIKFQKEKLKTDFYDEKAIKGNETKEILRISSPILLSRYSNSILRTGENILVPKTLSNTLSYSTALSSFGAIKGMALPVLFFPSSVLNALSALLLPEMSEAVAKNKPYIIKNAVKKTVRTTWLLGVIFGAIFFFCGEALGKIIYSDPLSGQLIKNLSLIVPLMYLDSICDGILKGLDQQAFTFRTALADSFFRIILIILLVPKYSMNGFIGIMIFSNAFTCLLHVRKLLNLTHIKPNILKDVAAPIFAAGSICFVSQLLLSFINQEIAFSVCFALLSIVLFLLFLIGFKIIDIHDYL